jgi:molybdopterin converting factor small subunit
MEVYAGSIPELIDCAEIKYPGLKNYILDEQGQLRKHVQIFIGEDFIKDRKGLTDKIEENDEVYIMQALSGG